MQNLLKELKILLEKDERLVVDGKLLKNKVIELSLQLDPSLFKLLLTHDNIKKHFFQNIEGIYVFDKIKFQKFVSNKAFLPDSYTSFKNKIGLTVDDEFISESKEVVLSWPYKDCILEGGQTKEDQKRDEIFWNETLAPDEIDRLLEPKVLTNFKRYDRDGEHPVTDISLKDNLIIKGNNLIALHSLLKVYRGKVKLIYIDPPYNTGNDSFLYNDSFKRSSWLTFMRNRLQLAKFFLKRNGVIFIQIDDKQQAYLKVLCDEIFKEENFVNCIAVKMSEATSVKMTHAKLRFPKLKEYLLFYKRDDFDGFITIDKYQHPVWDEENNIYLENFSKEQRDQIHLLEQKPTNTSVDVHVANTILSNVKKVSLNQKIRDQNIANCDEIIKWKFENSYRIIKTAGASSLAKIIKGLDNIPNQDIAAELSNDNVLFFYVTDFNREARDPRFRIIFADTNLFKNPCDFWQDIKTSGAIADEGEVKLNNGKKPEFLIQRIIKMITNKNDLVLDYHLGSGTTCSVAHKMERQYIGIEQMDYGENDSVVRIQKVIKGDQTGISKEVKWSGGGNFTFCELATLNQHFIHKIHTAQKNEDLQKIWTSLQEKGFLSYKISPMQFDENKTEFNQLSIENQKRFLIEVLDKNMLYIPYSEIDNKDFEISDEVKELNHKFYSLK